MIIFCLWVIILLQPRKLSLPILIIAKKTSIIYNRVVFLLFNRILLLTRLTVSFRGAAAECAKKNYIFVTL